MSERAERLSLTVGVSVLTTMLLLLAAKNIRLKQLEQNGDNGGLGDPAEKPVVISVHADNSTTNRAEGAATN